MYFLSLRSPFRYNSKLTLLALPSVIYEPRFRGSIRNLVYSDQPNVPARRQEMRQPRDIKVSILYANCFLSSSMFSIRERWMRCTVHSHNQRWYCDKYTNQITNIILTGAYFEVSFPSTLLRGRLVCSTLMFYVR